MVLVTATVGFPQEIQGPTEVIPITEEVPTTEEVPITENDPKVLLKNAKQLLEKINKEYGEWSNKEVLAAWKYDSNLTDENLTEKINVSSQAANYRKKLWQEVKNFPWKELEDEDAKRQFYKFSTIGEAALPEEVILEKLTIFNSKFLRLLNN